MKILFTTFWMLGLAHWGNLNHSFLHRFDVDLSAWSVQVGENGSFARNEARGDSQCLHLYGDRVGANLVSVKPVANQAYTLEYDFFQPPLEASGYQAVVQHPRPEGNSYWWLEYGPDRFFLFTVSGGGWYNRWTAGGLPAGKWYRIRLQNTPDSVKVIIYDESGKRSLAESPSIPHDAGGPSSIVFNAAGNEKGAWGMKLDNIRLYDTPLDEREDYILRRSSLENARNAVNSEDVRTVWPLGMDELKQVETAFAAISSVKPSDWSAYTAADGAFDAAMIKLSERYHSEVIVKLGHRDSDWVCADIWDAFNADSTRQGVMPPAEVPTATIGSIPFTTVGFGRNCIWQDMPSRSDIPLSLSGNVKRIAILMAPRYDAELYGHDDSLIDVMQVELRYKDGFHERVVPVPADWKPSLDTGIGNPPMDQSRAGAYVVIPGHNAPLKELVLCDEATRAGWVVLAMSYLPGLPAKVPDVNMQRSKAVARKAATEMPTSARSIVVKSNPLLLAFNRNRGVLDRLAGSMGQVFVDNRASSPIFAVQMDGRLIYSNEFVVTSVTRSSPRVVSIVYKAAKPNNWLTIRVTASPQSAGSISMRATLINSGSARAEAKLIFPLLDGLSAGTNPVWYFPQRGGAASSVPFEGLSSYGGMAWLQLLDVSTANGSGITMRSGDTKGVYKVFAFRSSPNNATKPRSVADIPVPAHPVDPWHSLKGVHLSIQYLPVALKPGGSWSPPPAVIRAHTGDWRKALAEYRSWLATWWKPLRPCPDVYRKGFYALVGGAPPEDMRGEDFGSYDWWHLNPIWSVGYLDEIAGELTTVKRDGERAAKWGQHVGLYLEGMCLEKSRRVAGEHGLEWAMKDDMGRYYDYYSTEANPVLNMCPADANWRKWDANAYAAIASTVDLCALYIDSTGSRWAEACYNPDHHHDTPGIWPRGCGDLFEEIRQAVMKVSPKTAIHSEEPGCDYMALHEDGSWSHSLWTNVSGDCETNPAGINYFHFVLPSFKMYEIPSYRHALWRCKLAFFNGEGLWTAMPDAQRRGLFRQWFPVLRKYVDVFQSNDISPAVPIVKAPLYANRFHRGNRTIYTIYNAGLRSHTADLNLPIPAKGSVTDLLRETAVKFGRRNNTAVFSVTVDPHEVQCYLLGGK